MPLLLSQEYLDKVKLIIEENMTKRNKVTPPLAKGLTQAQSQPLDSELYTKLSEVLTRDQMNQWNRMLELVLKNMEESLGSK